MYVADKRSGIIKNLPTNIFISKLLLSFFNIIIPIPDNNCRALISTFYNNIFITTKSADKGSVVAVWDRDDYIKEAEEHWEIKIFVRMYVMIPNFLSAPYMKQLKKFVKEVTWMQIQLSISWWKTQSLLAFTYSRKYINDCVMFLIVLLFQTAFIIPKTYLRF